MRKRNLERMRYKNDTLSSSFCLMSIACNVVFFISIYSGMTVIPDWRIGVDIIINIIFMLLAFLAGEEAKVYNRKWALGMMALAAVQTARVFWLPQRYHELGQLMGGAYLTAWFSMALSAAFMMAGGILCCLNSTALRKYLNKRGA